MAAYRRVDDLQSPTGGLPVHRDQLRAQRSVSSMGSLYLFTDVFGVAHVHFVSKLTDPCLSGNSETVCFAPGHHVREEQC